MLRSMYQVGSKVKCKKVNLQVKLELFYRGPDCCLMRPNIIELVDR
jgi:hypothetical protein